MRGLATCLAPARQGVPDLPGLSPLMRQVCRHGPVKASGKRIRGGIHRAIVPCRCQFDRQSEAGHSAVGPDHSSRIALAIGFITGDSSQDRSGRSPVVRKACTGMPGRNSTWSGTLAGSSSTVTR